MKQNPITISVSRQFGSGGGALGISLAKKLHLEYLDREIIMEAAKELKVPYEEVAPYDEANESFWGALLRSFQYGDYAFTPAEFVPSDEAIHRVESEIILAKAKEQPMVVVGRGANFILNGEKNHVSIYVHAAEEVRIPRVCNMFQVNENEAKKMLQKTDHLREQYVQKFHRHSSYDLRYYDLTINTGEMDFSMCEGVVLSYLEGRFGKTLIDEMKKDGEGPNA